ncbi:MAG: peptidylprolyl isomerase, partial [Planktomarina sp.]|nr:peptidylprolyl isomerase [Planktomarina sp.]
MPKKPFMSLSLVIITLIGFSTKELASEGVFDTVISVNKAAITNYELEQRIRFFSFLNEPGDADIKSRKSLIDDRLKMAAARKEGITLTSIELEKSMSDFAKNSNQGLDALLKLLKQGGVDSETFRDFVEVGVVWREVVRKRFASQVNPTTAEIDRAVISASTKSEIKVLLTEIILPAGPSQIRENQKVSERLAKITSIKVFSEQAAKLSVSNSRDTGGKLPWKNLKDIPDGLRQIIAGLQPGQVTTPLEVKNAIVLFQLRDIAESPSTAPEIISIEFARIKGPGSALELALKTVDSCDDLYGLIKLNKDFVLTILTQHPGKIEQGVALRLNSLDKDETSIFSNSPDGEGDIIMLCKRDYKTLANRSRDQIVANIRSARLTNLAEGYLAELRTNATVVFK